jgi:hypothetical protein
MLRNNRLSTITGHGVVARPRVTGELVNRPLPLGRVPRSSMREGEPTEVAFTESWWSIVRKVLPGDAAG